MDQLHEELKEVVQHPPNAELLFPKTNISQIDTESIRNIDDDDVSCSSPSLSEAEYETCDSGVSEQSSLSDETTTKRSRSIYSSSPQRYFRPSSPTAILTNQRQIKSNQSAISSRSSSVASSMSPASSKDTSANLPAKLPHRSIISDVFDGKLLSSVQCLTCDRVSTREETFQDLSLPIPGKDHLSVLQQQSQSVIIHQPIGITCTDAVSENDFVPNSYILCNDDDVVVDSLIKSRQKDGGTGCIESYNRGFGDRLCRFIIVWLHFSVLMS